MQKTSHTDYKVAKQKIQPYLHNWTKLNNLKLNAGKTTSTLFTPDPAEYSKTLTLKIDNTILPTVKNPKILGLTLDPKLTYNKHVQNITTKAKNTLNILKALTSTKWGKQKETLTNTYKMVTRPVMEYASTVWSPVASQIHINKLQVTQNTALRIATGCTQDTNLTHLHTETKVLPIPEHLKLHASQLKQKAQDTSHPLHNLTLQPSCNRYMKQTIFNNNYTHNIDTDPDTTDTESIKQNMKTIHTAITQSYLQNIPKNKMRQLLTYTKTKRPYHATPDVP
jgi:hypothetical protein